MKQRMIKRYRKYILKYGFIEEKYYPPNWWYKNGYVVLRFRTYIKDVLAVTCEEATRYYAYKGLYYTIKKYLEEE